MDSDVQVQGFSIKKLLFAGKKLHWVSNADLNINDIKPVQVKGRNILLCRSEDGYFAVSETCAHRSASLAHGIMVDNTLQCLKHGCRYDIKTGRYKHGPGKKDLASYKVVIKNNEVYIEL